MTKISFEEISSTDLFLTNTSDTPKTKSILAILEPSIPPIAISEFPLSRPVLLQRAQGGRFQTLG